MEADVYTYAAQAIIMLRNPAAIEEFMTPVCEDII
jgi:hypothetical protein